MSMPVRGLLLAVCLATPALAQKDTILLHDGTVIENVRIQAYDIDKILWKKGSSEETRKADQVAELQAMGMVMGDLLAQDLGLHWVVYADRVGRTRALRYRDTDAFLFPVTLVSRRWEAGDRTPVAVIYATARDNMREDLPPVPFQ